MLNSNLKNARLLIVDDQESNIALLESVLERDGFTDLKSTTDPRQVVSLLDQFQPDLILLDLRMPHLDGFEVMEQLRVLISPDDYLPILVLTADITTEIKLRALAAGARDFLTKPLEVTEVTLRIQNLLETRYLHLLQKEQNRELEERIQERTAELHQHMEDLALINSLNVAINLGEDLQKIIVLISFELYRIFKCIGTITAFPKPGENFMRIEHIEFQSPLSNQIERLAGASIGSLPLKIPMSGPGHFARVFQTGIPKAFNDPDSIIEIMTEYTEDKLLKHLASPVRKILGIGSMLLIPLISGTEIYGLLEMARTEHTSESDLNRIFAIAGQLTTAIGRKRSEDSLRESEARFRAVVETANDAIISTDTHGNVIAWNQAAENIFGYTAEEIVGEPVNRIVPHKLKPEHRHGMERTLTTTERKLIGQTITATGLAKDGREFPIEMSLAEWDTPAGKFFTSIIRDITERKQRENELNAISTLSTALRTAPSRAEMLPVIVEQMVSLLRCDSIDVEMIDPLINETVVEAAHGVWNKYIGMRQPPDTGLNVMVTRTRQPYLCNNIDEISNIIIPKTDMEGIRAMAGVPMIAHDQLIGLIWMGRVKDIAESEINLLASIANIAANAIHRATLHERTLKYAEEITFAYDTTLEGWAHALELRDQETEGHARNVVQLTIDLTRRLGIPENQIEHVRRGALLHDIGKMGIPDSVLLKPGPLTPEEWAIMQRHPEYAYQLLKQIEYLHPALDIPYCHHEKWDGSGYPRRLKGEEIPIVARIFAIIDVWYALMSDRPYRKAWTKEKTREYLIAQSGLHFEPEIVRAFLEMMEGNL